MDEITSRSIELGSAEAAVLSVVSLMAAVTGQREKYLAYWLDLYWQVRSAYEQAKAPANAVVLSREDAESLLMAMIREKMEDRTATAAAPEAEPEAPKAEPEACDHSKKSANAKTDTDGTRRPGAKPGNTIGHDTAVYKRQILERIKALRAQGLTCTAIAEACRMPRMITSSTILGILDGQPYKIEVYRAIGEGLDRLKSAGTADCLPAS